MFMQIKSLKLLILSFKITRVYFKFMLHYFYIIVFVVITIIEFPCVEFYVLFKYSAQKQHRDCTVITVLLFYSQGARRERKKKPICSSP